MKRESRGPRPLPGDITAPDGEPGESPLGAETNYTATQHSHRQTHTHCLTQQFDG